MARPERPRFIPPRIGKRDHARVSMLPRWFLREAVPALGLSPYAFAAFCVIADNLGPDGASKTALTLVAERGGMSRGGASLAIEQLLAAQLIFELDERQKGKIMRYAISAEKPYLAGWQ